LEEFAAHATRMARTFARMTSIRRRRAGMQAEQAMAVVTA
jgi:hypothetical protein